MDQFTTVKPINTSGSLYEDSSKFYYFVVSASLAGFAYLVKELDPVKLGLNSHTIEIGGLALLLTSIYLGFSLINYDSGLKHASFLAYELMRVNEEIDVKIETLVEKEARSEEELEAREEVVESYRETQSQNLKTCKTILKEQATDISNKWKVDRRHNFTLIGSMIVLAVARILEPYLG